MLKARIWLKNNKLVINLKKKCNVVKKIFNHKEFTGQFKSTIQIFRKRELFNQVHFSECKYDIFYGTLNASPLN